MPKKDIIAELRAQLEAAQARNAQLEREKAAMSVRVQKFKVPVERHTKHFISKIESLIVENERQMDEIALLKKKGCPADQLAYHNKIESFSKKVAEEMRDTFTLAEIQEGIKENQRRQEQMKKNKAKPGKVVDLDAPSESEKADNMPHLESPSRCIQAGCNEPALEAGYTCIHHTADHH